MDKISELYSRLHDRYPIAKRKIMTPEWDYFADPICRVMESITGLYTWVHS